MTNNEQSLEDDEHCLNFESYPRLYIYYTEHTFAEILTTTTAFALGSFSSAGAFHFTDFSSDE